MTSMPNLTNSTNNLMFNKYIITIFLINYAIDDDIVVYY